MSEGMLFCPWCGDLLRFRSDASFPRYCERCEHGLHDDWRRCPWCGERYVGATPSSSNGAPDPTPDARYEDGCDRCGGPMMRYMSFCPWCGEAYTWHTRDMHDHCGTCGFSVEKELFGWCPWCGTLLHEEFAEQARERIEREGGGRQGQGDGRRQGQGDGRRQGQGDARRQGQGDARRQVNGRRPRR